MKKSRNTFKYSEKLSLEIENESSSSSASDDNEKYQHPNEQSHDSIQEDEDGLLYD